MNDDMGMYVSPTFDDLYGMIVGDLSEVPQFMCSPRGQKIKEGLAITLILEDPRNRLLSYKSRDAQYGFGVGEFMWYWTGKQDLETLLYYNKRAGQFSDDGRTVNSAYGFRLFNQSYDAGVTEEDGQLVTNQWLNVKSTLLDDPDSRRAVMTIFRPEDAVRATVHGSKDVPCTLSLQFFIRQDQLHLHTHMRSNDAVWGLTYDLFSFTLLQEMMMLELRRDGMSDLQLGRYYHTAGSLHIYERHFEMAQNILKEYLSPGFQEAASMEPLDLDGMVRLVEHEEALRTGRVGPDGSARFDGGVRWMAEQLEAHRRKRDAERSREVGR